MIITEEKIKEIKGEEKNIYRIQYNDRSPLNNGWSVQVSIMSRRSNEFFKDGHFNDDPKVSFEYAKRFRDEFIASEGKKRPEPKPKNEYCMHFSGNANCRYVLSSKAKSLKSWDSTVVTCSACIKFIRDMERQGLMPKKGGMNIL